MIQDTYQNYFDDFRPYNEKEAQEALERLSESQLFFEAFSYFFPETSKKELLKLLGRINSVYDFQAKIMAPVVERIIENSSDGLSYHGTEHIQKGQSYIFLSNHRDIFLDAALHQYILLNNNHKTCEITFGNNLMQNPVVADAGKINKMFKVYRKGKPKELMEKTGQLSEYIKYAQTVKNESIWIAQRGGRTKDGNDKTQYGVLKMLCSARSGSFAEKLQKLNIIPVTVSYEFEPNDYLKVRESYLSKNKPYIKAPNEDINSIIDGINSQKGRINLQFGKALNREFDETADLQSVNAQAKAAAAIIDTIMYSQYQLFPNNYIAGDILNNNTEHSRHYTSLQKETFINYMNRRLALIEFSAPELKQLFLKIYAAPVYNKKSSLT
jgi:hypothetical protein